MVRAEDSSCPFCGTRLRPTVASSLTLGLVLTLGLGMVTIACGGDDKEGETVGNSASASMTATDSNASISDSRDADAVTYAGPDENTSINDPSVGTTYEGTTDYTSTTSLDGSSSSSSSSSATETGCGPINDDPSAIGNDCEADDECPDGYTCQPFQGIVFQMQCQILCGETCECPKGLTCNETADKSGATWSQCG